MSVKNSVIGASVLSPELLKARALEYAREEEKIVIQEELKEFLSFRLGEEWCLVEMCFVDEIVRPMKLARLPRQAEFLKGMMNVRGTMTLVIDFACLFKQFVTPIGEHSRIVLLKYNDKVTGVVVDEVEGALRLDTGMSQASISTIQGIEAEFINGLFVQNEKHSIWLNTERILLEVGNRLQK